MSDCINKVSWLQNKQINKELFQNKADLFIINTNIPDPSEFKLGPLIKEFRNFDFKNRLIRYV